MRFAAQTPPTVDACDDLIRQMESLRRSIEQQAEPEIATLAGLSSERLASAQNLLHYLALRNIDLRPLQDRLARLGLSSLGRAEAHVLATIDAVLHNLYLMSARQPEGVGTLEFLASFDEGADQLELNTIKLLGEHPKKRRVHIMVTMSSDAAHDYLLVHQLLESGMNCMRINCANDDPTSWSRMIEHLRHAQRATGQSCRILMDLGGPKLRLGRMEQEPTVLKIKPLRASDGRVLKAARIWLHAVNSPSNALPSANANLQLDVDWLAQVKLNDRIRFRDVRGSRRSWRIMEVTRDGCWAEAKKTSYIANGTVFHLHDKQAGEVRETELTSLPAQESVCITRSGDLLQLVLSEAPGKPAVHDCHGVQMNPGRLSLAVPEVYRYVRKGESISFDDGRITGIVEKVGEERLQIRITHTRKPEEKLGGKRGVNLPDSCLSLPALSAKDRQDLEFVVRYADMVGLSFANSPGDVRALHQRLQQLGRTDIGVVLKIETKRGFSMLPAMLLEVLKFPACGIMIARGDLAVECGFERLSEIQEEILWVCEAAHVPVIWATQVLEGLTRRGHASRAEITDAAMAQAAEAVMLNKGAHIIEAVEMLDDILQRMQGHHRKKRSMLRKLHLATEVHANPN